MKKRILCFGDSNTWGYQAIVGERYDDDVRWTGKLQAMLGDGYTVIEEGHNGRTTVWDDPVENRLAGLTYLWPCLESQSPLDLVIIMVGTNDTKYRFGETARGIADGAGRLVDMVRKSQFGRGEKAPRILLVSPIRITYTDYFGDLFGQQAVEKSEHFSAEYLRVAEKYGCDFMDAASVAEPCPYDGVHLDAEGHAKLAAAMYDKVKQLIG